jgi:hypothetical protein
MPLEARSAHHFDMHLFGEQVANGVKVARVEALAGSADALAGLSSAMRAELHQMQL